VLEHLKIRLSTVQRPESKAMLFSYWWRNSGRGFPYFHIFSNAFQTILGFPSPKTVMTVMTHLWWLLEFTLFSPRLRSSSLSRKFGPRRDAGRPNN
jgi:hypothetical protein